ncbi:MAG: nucleotidyl transferase AbiEii/AbiGii toxin family protein [Burkholderiales bacterium]|nr:nucleotidyl transferase AbiEii/AbiGii toxin family protein [Burkholderiales bacterium]
MTGMLKPRLDVLPRAQQRLWPQLSKVRGLGFVLYGGTAIALRLGHRESVDFDFFSEHPL